MPNKLYAQLWLEAREDLEKLLADDKVVQDGKLIEDRQVAVNIVLRLYFRYRRLVKRLTTSYDQIVQPQIREIVGRMLDYSIARMLECRQELVNLTFLECPWPNDVLLDMKLTPDDVELKAPAYDVAAREAEFARRKKVVEIANRPIEDDVASEASSMQTYVSEVDESRAAFRSARRARGKSRGMSVVLEIAGAKESAEEKGAREARQNKEREYREAIVLVQSHERARLARRVAKNAMLDRDFRAKLASEESTLKKVDSLEQSRAATVIGRCWLRFRARRDLKNRNERLEELLGMIMPSWRPREADELERVAFHERLEMQLEASKKQEDTIAAQRQKMWQIRGPALVEDIRDEIRQWFATWFNELGYFDFIPSAQDGGSTLIATGQARTPAEFLATPADDKKKKPAANDQMADLEDEDEEEVEEPAGWQMSESKVFPLLIETNEEFAERWSRRTSRILDPRADLIVDLITEPLGYELQLEMRRTADDSMRGELDQLNQALIADSIENKAAIVLPKPQRFEKEEVEPTKAAKPRVDPLADVPEDELLIELTRDEVLRDCPEERLSDWPGAVSYAIRADKTASLGDVLQPVMDYCVLAIGSRRVNELAPEVRSVCLCGPPGCGQLFIARAICAELKATVFDLTPQRHVGRFLQRSKQDRLVQSVLKLARSYAPSIVLVENESAFLKKVPLEMRRVQPKRFAAIYRKIVKGIKPGDQVLFLTASQQPYMASRSFVKLHDKFIIIPLADYSTLYRLYKNALAARPGVDRRIDVSALARVTVDETPMELARKAVQSSVPIARRMRFKRQPLRPEEILEKVFELAITKKELQDYAKFRAKLPLELKRAELELEEAEQQQSNNKKK